MTIVVVGPIAVVAALRGLCTASRAASVDRQDGGADQRPEHGGGGEQRHDRADAAAARSAQASERPRNPVTQVTSGTIVRPVSVGLVTEM